MPDPACPPVPRRTTLRGLGLGVLAGLTLGGVPPRRAAAAPPEIRFRILREGSAIGTHRVLFRDSAGGLAARTEVNIEVRLMGFTVFRYAHRFEELWAGDRLRAVTSRTERNGRVTEAGARAEAGGLLVTGPEGTQRLPAEAAPLSWWDPTRFGRRPLFDANTGKLLRVEWQREARPGGVTLWRAGGEAEGEGRYAADGAWLDWRTRGEDGSTVTYERA